MIKNKPLEGSTWLSPDGMSFYIEHVSEATDGFYTVEIIDTGSKDDPFAEGDLLTSNEWLEMVNRFQLSPQA
ncbi:TPA: hypothetical protein ACGUMO_001368 [Vibrio vulnificus]|uniref:hypothetical protein n=1 Tax=Vibrio vulnificus TaxID=672 RepID=UPI0006AD5349|nr:hypothetical protein [Vibrio vulnificus]EHH0751540.1 hypothetical protein [Vibrio vulnificus]KOR95413.1 hypothetical protein LO82_21520 [Vibrio vulnificus]HDY8067693.1 hypothetical protein [Vibrio vulnificus]